MRGIFTPITKIRRQVFEEVARMAYNGGDYAKKMEEIPFKLIPGEIASYRDSVFKERAILGERLRLAVGLDVYSADIPNPISEGVSEAAIAHKVYQAPLINIIPFACDACPTKTIEVTENCRGCMAHPCTAVCPVNAISIVNGKSLIDQEKCIKCGRCKAACPYSAIIQYDRPCASACGVDAIESDALGRAKINYDKCVSCGMCLVSCPFGAIVDKTQIFQLIQAIKRGDKIVAILAPAFVGQFGPLATPEKLTAALLALGFADVREVAIGADLATIDDAKLYIEKIPTKELPFLGTSCCPSWSVMAKTEFPELSECISMELTPMVATARLIKKEDPDARVVFIGPCASKKLEASRRTVRSDVSFVITFEEVMGMFAAKDIEFDDLQDTSLPEEATSQGRSYAVAGSVAESIKDCIHELDPSIDVKIDHAEGLRDCKKMLKLAAAGRRDGYLLEGMACPGGCVGGAGTITQINRSTTNVKKFTASAKEKSALKSEYIDYVGKLD